MKEIHGDYGPGTARAKKQLCNGGYKTGGDITLGKIKKVAKKAVREHESQEHHGKHAKLKLKSGGGVKGEMAKERPDRRARGGAAPKGKVGSVNIMIGKSDDGQDQQGEQMKLQQAAKAGLQKGVQIGQQMAAHGGPPPGAGMPPPGAGGPPPPPMAGPGGPPPPMPMRKKGGYVADLDAGAGSARGRMEKAGMIKVRGHSRRRAGGACD